MESLIQQAFEKSFGSEPEQKPVEQSAEQATEPATEPLVQSAGFESSQATEPAAQTAPFESPTVSEPLAPLAAEPSEPVSVESPMAAPVEPVAAPAPLEPVQQQDDFGIDFKEARILVIGAGGAGNNTVNRLTNLGIKGAKTVALNTDAKHLSITSAEQKVLIGKELTKGLGAGGYPDVGKRAAEESEKDLKELLQDCDMLYIVAGLGGGTGTGGTPVIAKIAKEMGAIVIGCVTMPFKIEGARIGKAEDGLYQLRQVCDTVIVIENDRLLKIAGDLPIEQAFSVADDLISTMIKGVTETISVPSLVNLDYADVKTIMHSGGVAAVGFGESDTKNRAEDAVTRALSNSLLEVDYTGGSGALIHITGGKDLKLDEVNLIGEYVSKQLDPDAQVIWGSRIDPEYTGKLKVITIVTGVKSPYILGPVAQRDEPRNVVKELGLKAVVQ